MRVYLAGPMRGLPDWNFPTFDKAEAAWRGAGHIPFSPAQVDRALKYGIEIGESDAGLRHVIAMDIACIMNADAIALLPGWENSTGATVELALAQFLGLPVYDAETMQRIYPISRPWHRPVDPLIEAGKIKGSNGDEKMVGDWSDCWRQLGSRKGESDGD